MATIAATPIAVNERPSPVAEQIDLPLLEAGQHLDVRAIRDRLERMYFCFVVAPSVIVGLALVGVAVAFNVGFAEILVTAVLILSFIAMAYIVWKLTFASIQGNSIEVGPRQYPQIHDLVVQASQMLGIEPPRVLIFQGHGLFEVFVAKRFSRRGFILLTSNLLDDLSELGSSRELMFFIGRQLGLMATGFFRFWFFKFFIGRLAFLFHKAWERRCHFTADRLGLLVAGDLYAAEQALITITAGVSVAPSTNLEALREQRREHFESPWSWVALALSSYPYMIDRILRLREFAFSAASQGVQAGRPVAIGALPLAHKRIRALPVMLLHGHAREARLELENLLFRHLPHVVPIAMVQEQDGAQTLPEKFEDLAVRVKGAIAILTPDDLALTLSSGLTSHRPRQNVVMEIGYFWGRIGRQRCLLLARGDLELPSDLQGTDCHRFTQSPRECFDQLLGFLRSLEAR